MRSLLPLLLLAAGCLESGLPVSSGSDGGVNAHASLDGGDDAGPPTTGLTMPDAATPDLTMPSARVDCSQSPIAGTCVERFFASMLGCFDAGGACVRGASGSSFGLCFANGDKVVGIPAPGTNGEIVWEGSGACFMKAIVTVDGAGVANFQYVTQTGPQLSYDEHTGDATCPDGTVVHIGPNDGCSALGVLLAPWRTAMCSDGKCQ